MSAVEASGLKPFDPADYLTTPEAVMEYLNAVLAENDRDFLHEALATIARAPVISGASDLSRASPSKADLPANPDFEDVARFVATMGLRLQVVSAEA